MNVRFKSVMPVLRVADLERSLQFYEHTLGFARAWRSANDGDGENCMLEAGGGATLMLSTGSHLGDRPQMTGSLYFDIEGVKPLYEAIRDRVEVVWPLSEMAYGTVEFGIRDPDGYTLAFAEHAGSEGARRNEIQATCGAGTGPEPLDGARAVEAAAGGAHEGD